MFGGGRARLAPAMVFAVTATLVAAVSPVSAADSPSIELISVDSTGAQVGISSSQPSMSADGVFVAFWAADDLTGDGDRGIYLFERSTGTLGHVVDGQSPQLSADGSVMLFISRDDGLVSNDANGSGVDAFLWTRQTGEIELVSIAPDGTQMTEFRTGMTARLSSDGTVAIFTGDVVFGPEDENGVSPRFELYRRDLAADTTALLSAVGIESTGGGGWDAGTLIDVDGDGSRIAYGASNEIASGDDAERGTDLYVFDVAPGSSSRLTRGEDVWRDVSISDDGNRIAAVSDGGGVLAYPDPPSGNVEIFVYDLPSQMAVAVDTNNPGHKRSQISPDGRWVAYLTAAALDTADTNGTYDWYAKDTFTTMTTDRLTVPNGGGAGTGASSTDDAIAFSGDGSVVAFSTRLDGLVAGDSDGGDDVFVRVRGDITGPEITAFSIQPNPAPVGAAVQIDATADDTIHPQFSDVSSIDYSIDGGPFVAMEPIDGAFDSPVESAQILDAAVADGTHHQICVRGRDATGRVGLASCQLLDVPLSPLSWSVTVTMIEDLAGVPADWHVEMWLSPIGDHTQDPPSFISDDEFGTAIEPFWTAGQSRLVADGATVTAVIEVHSDVHGRVDLNPDPAEEALFIDVDPATGSWSGDIASPARCVNAAVLMCFDVSTVSESGDIDGDGLLDGWELFGLDMDGDGLVDLDLPGWGANPMHKDLFVEYDYTSDEAPTPSELLNVKSAFSSAPVDAGGTPNPDGLPGINLVIDTTGVDQLGGGTEIDDALFCGLGPKFYNAKADHFDPMRRWVFRYAIKGAATPADGCSGGQGEIGGNDFVNNNSDDGGTFMHELGHNLSQKHGGDTHDNYKPNYVSVMNYNHQFGIQRNDASSFLDYSPARNADGSRPTSLLPDIDEGALDEMAPPLDVGRDYRMEFVNGTCTFVVSSLDRRVDWNGDGDGNDSNVTVRWLDRNPIPGGAGPPSCPLVGTPETHSDFDNWSSISLPFRQFGDVADGAVNPADDDDMPTTAEMALLVEILATTNLEITIGHSPEPAESGSDVTVDISIANLGPNPADDIVVTIPLPVGTSMGPATPGCSLVGSDISCLRSVLNAGDVDAFDVVLSIANGVSGHIDVNASVENREGPDTDESDNAASTTVTVTTTNQPPEITLPAGAVVLEGNVTGGWSGVLATAAGVSASDPDPGDAAVLTSDAPDLLPVGDTSVQWTATDSHGAATSANHVITVVDTTPPNIDSVADIQAVTNNPSGLVVEFTKPPATDVVDPTPLVNCDPASGSLLPVGITLVTCTATDQSGNAATTTFEVEVALDGGPECTIVGTDGNDILFGTRGDDVICGFGGNDVIFGGRGSDRLFGGEGWDVLVGGGGPDFLYGEQGNDLLWGGRGADYLDGGPGTDILIGGPGNDTKIQ